MKHHHDLSSRQYREQLLKDPWRPRYHFCVPDGNGTPGDPNGCFYHDGLHHLMYLYAHPENGFCWGHVVSNDLLHWCHLPDALEKSAHDDGCFSGGAFVDDDDTAYLSFWVSGVANLSVYLRRMAMEGYILNLEIPEMREVLRLTNRISGNINQIAKHVHSTGRLYKDDLEDICKQQERIWEVIRNILLKLEAV